MSPLMLVYSLMIIKNLKNQKEAKTTKMAVVEILFTPFIFSWFMFLMLPFLHPHDSHNRPKPSEEWRRIPTSSNQHSQSNCRCWIWCEFVFTLGLKLVESKKIKKGILMDEKSIGVEKGKEKGFHFACFFKKTGLYQNKILIRYLRMKSRKIVMLQDQFSILQQYKISVV